MLLAAAYAGLAIENSMLGAAHSMANPLTARYGIVHGQAVATALPHVVRFNAEDPAAARVYAQLARSVALAPESASEPEAAARLAAGLQDLLNRAGLPVSLAGSGVPASAAPELASSASEQWTARFNPRSVSEDDFRSLFATACVP